MKKRGKLSAEEAGIDKRRGNLSSEEAGELLADVLKSECWARIEVQI